MAEQTTTNAATTATEKPAATASAGKSRNTRNSRDTRKGSKRGAGKPREPREFEQKILDLARVTRVTAGGKRMSFRCALVIGDKKGRVGFGISKGADVQIAVEKAYRQAKKNIVTVPLVDETIPYPVNVKFGAAVVMLKPAPKGTGLKSGGAVRVILEHAGVPNAVSKIMNSSNKVNLAQATMKAIKKLHQLAPQESAKTGKKKESVEKPVPKKSDTAE